jgi:hypothetical protein
MSQELQPQRSCRLAWTLVLACTVPVLLSSCIATDPDPAPPRSETEPTSTVSAIPVEAGEGFRGTPADRGEPYDVNGPPTIYDPAAPETLTVVLFGSGTCPPEPVLYTVGNDGVITLLTAYTGEPRSCIEDSVPITYTVSTPPEFDPNKGIIVEKSVTD